MSISIFYLFINFFAFWLEFLMYFNHVKILVCTIYYVFLQPFYTFIPCMYLMLYVIDVN